MTRLDFEAKTDRELLLLTAQTTNTISGHLAKMNGTLLEHNNRIGVLEVKTSKIPSWAWNRSGIFILLGSLIAGGIYAFGTAKGFW